MTRGEPERMVDDAPAARVECRRPGGLLPATPVVERAEDCRTEMPGPRGREHRAPIACIGDRVMDDMAEELRPGEPPAVAGKVARERPETLAGGNENSCLSRGRRTRRDGSTGHESNLLEIERKPDAVPGAKGATLRRPRRPGKLPPHRGLKLSPATAILHVTRRSGDRSGRRPIGGVTHDDQGR